VRDGRRRYSLSFEAHLSAVQFGWPLAPRQLRLSFQTDIRPVAPRPRPFGYVVVVRNAHRG